MQSILITGGRGTLGRELAQACRERKLAHEVTSREDLDVCDADAIARTLDRIQPWLVINATGYVRVDDAEADPERCHRDNALAPELLARACARCRIGLVTFSTDLVFDGSKAAPYDERDQPMPLGVYGATKHDGEQRVVAALPEALVIRTSAFFGPSDGHNFVTTALRELAAGRELRAASDVVVSPTYVPDLVHACLDLAIDGERGLWHLANRGAATWAELVLAAAAEAGLPTDRIIAVPGATLGWRAVRPAFSALASVRGELLPSLADAVRRNHQAVNRRARDG